MFQKLFEKALAFLIGDDIFVSYSRVDGATYAAGIATELVNRGFSCRLDQWGTEAGTSVPASLTRALRRSAALVLVGTPGAANSKHVSEEVLEMSRRRRPIVPIIFPGVRLLADKTSNGEKIVPAADLVGQGISVNSNQALWAAAIAGLPMLCECNEVLTSGEPSGEIVNRIRRTFQFWTKDQRLRISSMLIATVLLLLIGGSVWAARLAVLNAAKAAHLNKAALLAQEEATKQKGLASHASTIAREQEEVARAATKKAQIETARADVAAKQASRFEVEAQQQKQVAEARQLTNQASFLISRYPEQLVAGSALALRAHKLNPSADSDEILREVTELLPQKPWHKKAIGVAAVAISTNHIAAVAEIDDVTLWYGGNQIETIRDPHFRPTCLKFSRDGAFLLIGSIRQIEPAGMFDLDPEEASKLRSLPAGKLRMWDLNAKREVWHVSYDQPVTSVAFNEPAELVAVGTGTATTAGWVQELSFTDGSLIRRLDSPLGITGLAFSPNGKYLAISSRIFNAEVGVQGEAKVVAADLSGSSWRIHDAGPVNGIAFSPDSRRVAIAANSSINNRWETQIWDTETKQIDAREMEATEVNSLCFLDNSRVVTAGGELGGSGWGRAFEIVGRDTRELVRLPHETSVRTVACDLSSDQVLAGDEDSISLWSSSRSRYIQLPHGDDVTAMSFRADGAELVTGTWNEGTVRVWRVRDWTEQSEFKTFQAIDFVSLSPDGEDIFVQPFGPQVGVFGRTSKSLKWESSISSESHISISGDWHYLVIGSKDKREIRLYDLGTRRKLAIAAVNGEIEDISFSYNGKFIAAAVSRVLDVGAIVGSFVEFWGVEPDRVLRLGQIDLDSSDVVMNVSLSHSGSLVAAATLNRNVRISNTATSRAVCSLVLPSDINRISFSNDESYLAVATRDGFVHIIDTKHCGERERISQFGRVSALAFSPDNELLLTGGEKAVRITRWKTTDVANELCSRLLPIVNDWRSKQQALGDFRTLCPSDPYH